MCVCVWLLGHGARFVVGDWARFPVGHEPRFSVGYGAWFALGHGARFPVAQGYPGGGKNCFLKPVYDFLSFVNRDYKLLVFAFQTDRQTNQHTYKQMDNIIL